DAAKGFRAEPANTARLLGLDAYLELSPAAARLVRVRDGVVLGLLPRAAADLTTEVAALSRWALPFLTSPGTPSALASDYLPQVETDAIEPYYRGLAAFDAGRFADAVVEFTRAYQINGRFREAYEGAARAHEALGLPEIAFALRRYLATELLENLPSSSGRAAPVDGVAFLGIDSAPGLASVAADLAAASASALAFRSDLALRLPDQLTRLRRERDWLLGSPPDPTRDAPPAVFTRRSLHARVERAEGGGLLLRWTLRDTLGFLPPDTSDLALSPSPASWPGELQSFLAAWPSARPAPRPAPLARPTTPDRPAELALEKEPLEVATALAFAEGLPAERLRLRLLQIAPEHPLCIARRPGRDDEPLASFLDHGRVSHVVARLPRAHPQRRWLELMQALEQRDPFSPAHLFGLPALDTDTELERLAHERPDDGPGLVARYYLLFARGGAPSADDIVLACDRLRAEANARPDALLGIAPELEKQLADLARLARLASEPAPADLDALDKFLAPTDPPALRWTPEGRLHFAVEAYAITRRHFIGLAPPATATEARALLALNGRGHTRKRLDPTLLAAHPGSLSIAYFAVKAIDDIETQEGLPHPALSTWAEETAYVRDAVAYIRDACLRGYAERDHPEALRAVSTCATALLGVAASHHLGQFLPPGAYATLQHELHTAETAARARLAFPDPGNSNAYTVARLTPDAVAAFYRDFLSETHTWIASPDTIAASLRRREERFADATKPGEPNSWWWLARRWETRDAFSAPARAELLARHLEHILRLGSDTPDDAEIERLFDLGLFLQQGRRDADAERVLRRVASAP
ncbi:MAG: hypothetical protein H7067_01080, partial [Burkholderiales bacterium]|nr:hypothetical protein [Opitutaceae bacterium]